MSLVDVERLKEIAEVEFADIVVEALIPDLNKLRVVLTERRKCYGEPPQRGARRGTPTVFHVCAG